MRVRMTAIEPVGERPERRAQSGGETAKDQSKTNPPETDSQRADRRSERPEGPGIGRADHSRMSAVVERPDGRASGQSRSERREHDIPRQQHWVDQPPARADRLFVVIEQFERRAGQEERDDRKQQRQRPEHASPRKSVAPTQASASDR